MSNAKRGVDWILVAIACAMAFSLGFWCGADMTRRVYERPPAVQVE